MTRQSNTVTYPMPDGGWVCFHCGKRIGKYGQARDHFGDTPKATPACLVTAHEVEVLRMENRHLRIESGRTV